MKKTLLLFLLICTPIIVTAQNFTQPTVFNRACGDDNDGQATFYMGEISYEFLTGLNAGNYVVTHHLTQSDASAGINPLPGSYTNVSNPQLIFARIVNTVTSQVTILTYNLIVFNPVINNISHTFCDSDSDGIMAIDFAALNYAIWYNNQDPYLVLQYFLTMQDAMANTNEIPQSFSNTTPFFQTLYVRSTNPATGCIGYISADLSIDYCTSQCTAPGQITSSPGQFSADLTWDEVPGAFYYQTFYVPAGGPGPSPQDVELASWDLPELTVNSLTCGTAYDFYVRSVCGQDFRSSWTGPVAFTTLACTPSGPPSDLVQCNDGGIACFNLLENDNAILGNFPASDYTITYHHTQSDAATEANAIANAGNYCSNGNENIFIRVENNTTQQYDVFVFSLIVQTVAPGSTQLANIQQCDDDQDGSVLFDVASAAQAQITMSGTLEYYQNYNDAIQQANPIANPNAYSVNTFTTSLIVYLRLNATAVCDLIYSMLLLPSASCNQSSSCINANSLCRALGAPFNNSQNTTVTEPGANYGCLSTHPNPTWFYLPVSSAGSINLMVEQNASIDFNGNSLDVDYIVYGPFSTPATPCFSQLTANNIVSCSFSTNATEYPVIANAQIGQYYLIMTTNYSNQAGYIRITETATSQGEISCSGFRLNAFLDSNANGTKDTGEPNFPLGQFHFERNNDGNTHHISSPAGTYSIYEDNAAHSYDVSFTVDSAYSSSYSVSPSSYSNLHAVVGGGMLAYNFPVIVVQPYNDLSVTIVPASAPRPGFFYTNKIVYSNLGSQTVASGTVLFIKDAATTVIGNTQTGTTPTPTGFTYNFSNLLPFETRTMTVTLQVPSIPGVVIGQTLLNSASIAPLAGDIVPENNNHSLSQVVIGSYDPNDKMESHGDKILVSAFTSSDYLYYTIRFENTGTANAINVRITDTLDARLDETSVRMTDASHDYILDRVDNILTWKFDDIELPQSIAETATGKGYVTFKVKPKPGYAAGDIINNTASIFFDFNPAIVTNTYSTEFVSTLAVNKFERDGFVIYPNPANDVVTVSLKSETGVITNIAVTDMLGKTIFSKKMTAGVTSDAVNLKELQTGVYFIEVTTSSNLKATRKLIKK